MHSSSRAGPLRVVRPPATSPESAAPEDSADAAWVRRARQGDADAEDALYRRHARPIIGLVARLLGDGSEVDDVVQDTFLSAFLQLSRLREPAAFPGWLRRIAVDRVRRAIRTRRLQRTLGLLPAFDHGNLEALAVPRSSPELGLALARLDGALERLPTRLRLPWMLRHVEGLTLDELADACRCSRATAARRLAAAEHRLARRGVTADLAPFRCRS